MRGLFSSVGVPRVGRSMFNLSHEKKFDVNMFTRYPIMVEDCIPGDVWRISNEKIFRMNPTFAPILHEVNVFEHYFFVPYRILWDKWEEFISGGEDGQFVTGIPLWKPTNDAQCGIGTLWDLCGYEAGLPASAWNDDNAPHDLVRRAWVKIYNDYYRDQNLQAELDVNNLNNGWLYARAWRKDYFTSALPWQQRGISPGIPLEGYGQLDFSAAESGFDVIRSFWSTSMPTPGSSEIQGAAAGSGSIIPLNINAANTGQTGAGPIGPRKQDLEKGVVNFGGSGAGGIDIADLRLAIQVQRWMERNARTGVRYTEFLQSHFRSSPRDDRLDRPEYIGGSRAPIIVSEVLQTSASGSGNTPQGNLAGHGLAVDRKRIGTYRVREHGVIIGIMTIMPQPTYSQGVERMWLHRDKFDFPFPLFAHLSERPIYKKELKVSGTATDNEAFGFQGMYDEYRHRRSTVHGLLKPGQILDYWTLSRSFNTAPNLNADFIRVSIAERNNIHSRILAFPGAGFGVMNFGNILHVLRPLPRVSIPGMVDHF